MNTLIGLAMLEQFTGNYTDTTTNTQLSQEHVEDFVGAMLGGTETGITVTYQDSTGDIDFVVATQTANDFTNTLKSKLDAIEASADVTDTTNVVANLPSGVISGSAQLPAGISIPAGTVSGSIQVSHDDTTGFVANEHIDWTADGAGTLHASTYTDTTTNTQLSQEQVEDFAGAMVASGGTKTGITITYQDSTGDMDFVVATQTANDFTNTLKTKLDAIEASADVTDATNVIAALDTLGVISGSAQLPSGTVSGSAQIDHDSTTNFVANEHIDWTSDQGGTNIHSGNYTDTNTTYAVQDGQLSQINFTSADNTKLDGIEASADVTDTTNVLSSLIGTELVVKTITAEEYVVSSSVTHMTTSFSSGSTIFGDTPLDTHQFTGSLYVSSSVTAVSFIGDGSLLTSVPAPTGTISGSAQLPSGIISGSAQLPSGTVSGSAQIDHDSTANFVANEHLDWTSNVGTIHSGNYTDTTTNTQLSQEQVEDFVGGMLGGTETGISVTYQDSTGDIDFVVATQTANDFTNTLKTKLDAIEASADVTDATNVVAALDTLGVISGSAQLPAGIISGSAQLPAGLISGSAQLPAGTVSGSAQIDHDSTTNFVANEHIDWTSDQGGTNIHSGNYTDTNTTYSVGDGGLSQINFTSADNTKLDGIEASADVTDATNVVAALDTLGVISGSAQLPSGIISGSAQLPSGTVSGSAQIDIHNTTGYVANEHLDWTSNVGTIHSGNYTDTTTNTQLSQEQVEDFVGGMLGGTETGITVTYQDSTGDIDFVVATQTANDFTNTLKTKLDAIEASADVTDATNVVAALTAGTNIAIAGDGTISSTDTNTTYSVTDGQLSQINFTSADNTKLDGIEASADVTDAANVLSSLIGTELVVKSITAETYVVSSSVTHLTTSFSSGSTIFGDDILDTHQFTGSLYVSGSLYGDGSNLTGVGGTAGTVSGSVQVSHDDTTGFVANEHLDWTSNVGTIHSGNYTDTTTNTQLSQEQVEDFVGGMLGGTETGITVTYQDSTGDIDFVVATQTANDFTNTLKSKLDAIEALADVTTATNVLSSLVASDLVVGTITAESYVISSSVTHMTTSFSSGSTIFGDDILDTHQMTGSLYVSGSLFFAEIDGGNF